MLAWRRGFYGYVIVVAAFFVYMFLAGSYYSLSVLVPVMAKELGWSATAFGAAFSVLAVVMGLSAPINGAIVVRFGPRLSMLIASLLAALAFASLSLTASLWQLYVSTVALAWAVGLGGLLAVQQIVGNWFVRRRALFLGLVLTGAGLGGLLIASLTSSLMATFGSWQAAWIGIAALMSVPGVVALLFIKDKPEQMGQQVDGASDEPALEGQETTGGQSDRVYKSTHQWQTRAALGTRAFWLVALAGGTGYFLFQAVTAHQVAYLSGEGGLTLAVAASTLGLAAGLSIAGRLLAGTLADRIEPRFLMAAFLLLQGLGLLLLITGQSLAAIYGYVFLYGVAYGGLIVLSPVTNLNYFGTENFAAIQGFSMPVGTLLAAVSPLIVGGIKDIGGSYVPAFGLAVGVALAGAFCALLARPPVPDKGVVAPVEDPA